MKTIKTIVVDIILAAEVSSSSFSSSYVKPSVIPATFINNKSIRNSRSSSIDPPLFFVEESEQQKPRQKQQQRQQQQKKKMFPQRTAAGILVSRNNGRRSNFVKSTSTNILTQQEQRQQRPKQYNQRRSQKFQQMCLITTASASASTVNTVGSSTARAAVVSHPNQKRKCDHNSRGPSPTTIITAPSTPEQQPPLLLLEGEDFYVLHEGVSRTFYELTAATHSSNKVQSKFAIEEFYNLGTAQKTFILRQSGTTAERQQRQQQKQQRRQLKQHVDMIFVGEGFSSSSSTSTSTEGVLRLGSLFPKVQTQTPIRIQEIDQGVFGSAGTGSTTWEASIAMSLFFSQNPHFLRGDVLELGSGVGLGGILTHLMPSMTTTTNNNKSHHDTTINNRMKSMTLTDHNPEVLQQCQKNILQNTQQQHHHNMHKTNDNPFLNVCFLDWNEPSNIHIDHSKINHDGNTSFDTIIACDCAYRYKDAEALAHTMATLLRQAGKSKIHIFGPYNRSALYELIKILEDKDRYNMNVLLDYIELKRYRLKPPSDTTKHNHNNKQEQQPFYWQQQQQQLCGSLLSPEDEEYECPYASKSSAKFLHITVSRHKVSQHKHSNATNDNKRSSSSSHISTISSSYTTNPHNTDDNYTDHLSDID